MPGSFVLQKRDALAFDGLANDHGRAVFPPRDHLVRRERAWHLGDLVTVNAQYVPAKDGTSRQYHEITRR